MQQSGGRGNAPVMPTGRSELWDVRGQAYGRGVVAGGVELRRSVAYLHPGGKEPTDPTSGRNAAVPSWH